MFRITREEFNAAGHCTALLFDRSPRYDAASDAVVYPDGFTDEEAKRIYRVDPNSLHYLIDKGLVPMTRADYSRIKGLVRAERRADSEAAASAPSDAPSVE